MGRRSIVFFNCIEFTEFHYDLALDLLQSMYYDDFLYFLSLFSFVFVFFLIACSLKRSFMYTTYFDLISMLVIPRRRWRSIVIPLAQS